LAGNKGLAGGLVLLLLTGTSLSSHGVSADGGVDTLVKLLVGFGLVVIEALGPESESSLVLSLIFFLNTVGIALNM